MSTITHWKFLPHLQPQRESFQVLSNSTHTEILPWNWGSSESLPTQPIPCFILDIGCCDPTGSRWGLCELSAGIQPPSGSRRSNTATPRNPPSASVLFLKDSYVLSLMPRSLEHRQLALFSVLIPFSMAEDCSIRWVFPLHGTEYYFPSSFNVLPLSRNGFFPSSILTLILIWNMCFPPHFPISFPQIHFSLLLLKEFLWLSAALLAITPLFA